MSPDEIVGRHVRALRQAAGLSQRDLAEAMGVDFRWDRNTVAMVEAGRRRLALDELTALAAYFDLPPVALITGPGTSLMYQEVQLGGRSLPARDWLNLWTQWDWQAEPSPRHHRAAINRLFSVGDRPWARLWRRYGGHPAKAFREAREEILSRRSRFPGPIYATMGTEPVEVSVSAPPWSTEVRITLQPGEPYVARDEAEAETLDGFVDQGQLRVIPRHTAQAMRAKRGQE